MPSPTYATIILQLTGEIDLLMHTFIFEGYQALAQTLARPLAGLCILSIILMGYGITQGFIKMPMQTFSKGVIRMGVIYLFAMNWGFFSEVVVNLFITSSSELGEIMMKAGHIDVPVNTGAGINGGLQSVLIEVIRIGAWTWNKASFKHWGPIFTALMIYFSGLAVIGFALFEIIIAKLMLTICLSTAPLFICFALFEQTKSFFEKWLGTLTGFSLLLVMVSSVVALCMHLIHWTIGGHYLNHAAHIAAVDWIPLFIVACLCVMALFEVASIAKNIGHACSTSTGAAMVGGFVGGALGAASKSRNLSAQAARLAKRAMPASAIANLNPREGSKFHETSLSDHRQGDS